MSGVQVIHADSRDVLPTMPAASFDACVCDPPYALVSVAKRLGAPEAAPIQFGTDGAYARAAKGFMGKTWDTGETAFDPAFWTEVLRVLKPGAHLIAFGGTRTYHRLATAVEDAGFEVRDMTAWLYGSGFPKSHDVAKAIGKTADAAEGQAGEWEGWGTAMKPALEPVLLARKPLAGTVAANVLRYGTGGLNIDACRVHGEDAQGGSYTVRRLKPGATLDRTGGNWRPEEGGPEYHGEMKPGRWPANVIHDGSREVLDAFPAAPGQQRPVTGAERAHPTVNTYGDFAGCRKGAEPRGDSGTAARFFYSAKADAADRLGSKHPTVKPVDLMAHFCRLITPPGGIVLDPFAGSGTTGMACLREGFGAVLIEREAEYVADIHRRLAHVESADTPLFGTSGPDDQPGLFDEVAA